MIYLHLIVYFSLELTFIRYEGHFSLGSFKKRTHLCYHDVLVAYSETWRWIHRVCNESKTKALANYYIDRFSLPEFFKFQTSVEKNGETGYNKHLWYPVLVFSLITFVAFINQIFFLQDCNRVICECILAWCSPWLLRHNHVSTPDDPSRNTDGETDQTSFKCKAVILLWLVELVLPFPDIWIPQCWFHYVETWCCVDDIQEELLYWTYHHGFVCSSTDVYTEEIK